MIVDALTGLYAAQAVGVALYRARAARRRVAGSTLSLTQSAAAILGHKLAEHVLEDGKPQVSTCRPGRIARDDGWVMIALMREADFVPAGRERSARRAGRPIRASREFRARAATRARDLRRARRQSSRAQTTAHWLEVLRGADILSDRINGFDDWLADPHIVATGGAVAVEPADMPAFKVPRTPGISPEADAALSPGAACRRARPRDPRRARGRRRRPDRRAWRRRGQGWSGAQMSDSSTAAQHRFPESSYFDDLSRSARAFTSRAAPSPTRISPRSRPCRATTTRSTTTSNIAGDGPCGAAGARLSGAVLHRRRRRYVRARDRRLAHRVYRAVVAIPKPVYPGDTLYPSLTIAALTTATHDRRGDCGGGGAQSEERAGADRRAEISAAEIDAVVLRQTRPTARRRWPRANPRRACRVFRRRLRATADWRRSASKGDGIFRAVMGRLGDGPVYCALQGAGARRHRAARQGRRRGAPVALLGTGESGVRARGIESRFTGEAAPRQPRHAHQLHDWRAGPACGAGPRMRRGVRSRHTARRRQRRGGVISRGPQGHRPVPSQYG